MRSIFMVLVTNLTESIPSRQHLGGVEIEPLRHLSVRMGVSCATQRGLEHLRL